MEPDYKSHKFEFFKTIPKQKINWRLLAFAFASFYIFMSSFILPVAYFQNYKNSHIVSTGANKISTVMKCEGESPRPEGRVCKPWLDKNSDIYCHISKPFFSIKIDYLNVLEI